jgi:serine/threonine-protein kinase
MELLEGETLASRLRRGALPEKEALRIGAEVAEALGAAHGKGVVHRDVKPGNVMLTRSGVKLLDFGLARLHRAPGPSGETVTATGFGEGVLAGTLPYMAPEQLEGREADARTDIWAVGCVLFEMLAGRRAFEGDSQARLIAAIEKDETPSIAKHRPGLPTALDRLVRECLRKDPAERWQSAQDLALRLRECVEAGAETETREPKRKIWRLLFPTLAGTVALALIAVTADRLWLRARAGPLAAPVVRSLIDLPPEAALVHFEARLGHPSAIRTELALSPDGRLLAWSGSPDPARERSSLYVRAMDTGEVRRIPGTEGAHIPFFSPDGRSIGFYSLTTRMLRKAPVGGGLAVDLAAWKGDPVLPMGASWAEDGRIFLGSFTGLHWVPSEGGPLRALTTAEPAREFGHRLPWALPGGRALLFTTMPHPFGIRAQVEAVTLDSGARKVVVEDAADARYLPTGHLAFVRQGVVMAAPFDVERIELKAAPVPVIEGVRQALNISPDSYNSAAAQLAISASGLLVYAPGGIFEDPPGELVLVDESGHVEPVPGFEKPLVSANCRLSPDGRWIAFVERARSGRLWLFDVERRTDRPLTRDGMAGSPVWSPDGSRVVVGWSKEGAFNLWSIPVEGEGPWERLTGGPGFDMPASWSADGRLVAFWRRGPQAGILLYRFADRQVVPFLKSEATEPRLWYPEFSPDGRWMAYVSGESGPSPEVYVTSFPDRQQTLVVSRGGGMAPAWSRDGHRLFYRSLDGKTVLAVSVSGGPILSLGRPTVLFPVSSDLITVGPAGRLELHPDGRRFLFAGIAAKATAPPVTRLTVVNNWFAELERLCPTRR